MLLHNKSKTAIRSLLKDYAFQKFRLTFETTNARKTWLLCALRLQLWINRDVAKMIAEWVNTEPHVFVEYAEL